MTSDRDTLAELVALVAKHRLDGPGCTGCDWHIHPLAVGELEQAHATHVVALITGMPVSSVLDGERLAFEGGDL